MPNRELQLENHIVLTSINFFRVPLKDITRKVRTKDIAEARQAVAYCLRLLTNMSFPEIGKLLGGRDHTTVLYACSRIAEKIEQDEQFRGRMETLLDKIRAPRDCSQQELGEYSGLSLEAEEEEVFSDSRRVTYSIPTERLELNDREKGILSQYRKGKTLHEISVSAGLTRERIRQVVLHAMLKEIGSKIKAGFEIDVYEYMRSEKMAHDTARDRMPEEERQTLLNDILVKAKSCSSISALSRDTGIPNAKLAGLFPEIFEVLEKNAQEKRSRWSRHYIKCRSCGTSVIPHRMKGYCRNCMSLIRNPKRTSLLPQSICAVCSIDRDSSLKKYGRDLYVTEEGKVLCRGCFLQFTGSRMAKGRWGRSHTDMT